MGSLDSTEVFQLVSLYLLNKISVVINSNFALYRDDDIDVIHNANGPKLDRLRKKYNCYIQKQRVEYNNRDKLS